MKKTFLALLSIAALMISCTQEKAVTPSLTYAGASTITTDMDGGIYTVEFDANTDWTAALSCSGEIANLSPAKGDASVKSLRVAVNPYNEENNRDFTLTITVEGVDPVVVNFHQTGLPFLRLAGTDNGEITMVNGTATFSVEASDAYTYVLNQDTMEGVTISQDGDTFTLTSTTSFINKTSCNVVITMGSLSVTVTCIKDGLAEVLKLETIPAEFTTSVEEAKYSLAVSGENVMVCNQSGLYLYKNDLTYVKQLSFPAGVTFSGITSDNAGNIVASEGAGVGETLKVYRLKAGNLEGAFEKFIEWNVAVSGPHGVGNIKAEGDVFSNGVVSLFSPGGWVSTATCDGVSFDITGGTAGDANVVAISGLPYTVNSVNWGIYFPCGASSADGFMAMGYPCVTGEAYAIHYYDGTEWSVSMDIPVSTRSDEYLYCGADVVKFNNKNICAFVRMGYWGGDTNEVIVVDITDPKAGSFVCSSMYSSANGSASHNNSIVLSVEGNALYAYFIDGGAPVWGKIKFAGI